MSIRIGVLALQGGFALHRPHLLAAGAEYVEVIGPRDFDGIDGLILPGGESGTLLKLIDSVDIAETLDRCLKTKPAWGICAGAILMAQVVRNPGQRSFGAIDIEIERNAYGRQLESSQELIGDFQVSYIRAPRIVRAAANVSVLAKREGQPSWVECTHRMATTFHPETSRVTPSPWHERLIEFCKDYRRALNPSSNVRPGAGS